MSSNEYSGYVSQNLARSSPFGYHEQATLRALLETVVTRAAQRNLPLAAMRAFPDFSVYGKTRMRTILQGTTLLPL
ncbi:hypothetical protein HJC06_30315 [Rhizobium sp. NLR9b]|uniref:hypothetical protein n=1 Tax=unclassified Rhizobium TaxID=2613769 RepID=UPI001C83499F|nr:MULTISPECIES: hypothetical protein [unclassified Rhizobium]MBX5230638.1 hypothetical protein [Rhizobium sp. NLR9b]MBX5291306.1 hypothetical protein [Rhizobium sp. NLR10b]